jgi:hypothetical protein
MVWYSYFETSYLRHVQLQSSAGCGAPSVVVWRYTWQPQGRFSFLLPWRNKMKFTLQVNPPNKCSHPDERGSQKVNLSLAGHGYEETRRSRSFSLSSSRWGIISSAFMISTFNGQVCHSDPLLQGRPCQMPQRRFCYTSSLEALTKLLVRSPSSCYQVVCPRRLQGSRRWKFTIGGEIEEKIAFSLVLLRSFMQKFRP